MSAVRKLFVGSRVRRLREQAGWTQQQLAQRLSLSLSYVSQIENNQRPVTAAVLLKLADVFGGDVSQFSEEQDRRLAAELRYALQDRTLWADTLPAATVARLVEQAPELVEAFVLLYQRYNRLQEAYAQMIDRYYGQQGGDAQEGGVLRQAAAAWPHEEVRDHFNRRNNYLDTLDRLAEALAEELKLEPGQRAAVLRQMLRDRLGVEVELIDDDAAPTWLRQYDPARRRLSLASSLSDAQQAFQMATQLALLAYEDAIEEELREGGFADSATQALARQGFAHYFAGALLLPYQTFLTAARQYRYDIERLQRRFHVSFETVCHRLSTLQRSGARGIPFYFVRVDQAGNISKRQSATAFHFAKHGGACPLWHVHEAFAQPGRILTQVLEMPDGTRFFGIARTTSRGGAGYLSRRKIFAIGLGCELVHAAQLVYADGLDLHHPQHVVPIGPGCRVCPREDCVQRAFPPVGKTLITSPHRESLVSYRFEPH
ncbi:MAG: short-chain fatty acyl-CoA regulator family protein [Tepidimonas sp.]|uniref:helix-turn-helix domain-containing protein n=1 Tax=Tepidimonas sp. TaxID=2002775 RepID=UPI00298F0ECE|nr:short-chain fatty acyl-CoA regulator family protein [Tepidimonas sp.]MDW8336081.1 short-chain fatty acyl-CoA regulator family protein [Tepidimonas sp.]